MAPNIILQLVLVATVVVAQRTASIWAQCGGSAYAGPTACASGNYCNYGNPWYSQCVPGSADDPLDSAIPDSPLQTNTQQTIITIGGSGGGDATGAAPTVVTTYFTYVTPSTTILATPRPTQQPESGSGSDNGGSSDNGGGGDGDTGNSGNASGSVGGDNGDNGDGNDNEGGNNNGGTGPSLTVIAGTTYTIIRDPPVTRQGNNNNDNNNKRWKKTTATTTADVPAVAPPSTFLKLARPTVSWTTIVTVDESR
ncbi:Cellulose-binding domain protein [Niveomyces insectorum RCEF 264]|uniref:Cellulose-binding domain protein n=1 Tax=Niveomyces insectorum RCEF 264 TaxID=1081102 RepID=A0A167ZQY8_9HYPO|nr:Cellulose-binding domain protein [Niveomyces insectorum RCEF 264]